MINSDKMKNLEEKVTKKDKKIESLEQEVIKKRFTYIDR